MFVCCGVAVCCVWCVCGRILVGGSVRKWMMVFVYVGWFCIYVVYVFSPLCWVDDRLQMRLWFCGWMERSVGGG